MLSVLIMVEHTEGLVETMRSLDLQTLDRTEYVITMIQTSADDRLASRLQLLERRRPNVSRTSTDGGHVGEAMLSALGQTSSDVVVPLTLGTHLHPGALERLVAASTGHAVVGRRSGTDSLLAAPGPLADLAPWPVVLAPTDLAREAAATASSATDARAWVAQWQGAVLAGDPGTRQLVDYPAVRGETLGTDSLVEVGESRLAWNGPSIHLEVDVVGVSTADKACFFLHEKDTGEEHPFPATVSARDGRVVVAGSLEPDLVGGALPAGEWLVGLDVLAGGRRLRGRVPNTALEPGIVRGRAVVRSLKRRYLALQVGRVKRNFVTADPDTAQITESVAGTRLRLPLQQLHLAETDALAGSIVLGGLPVRADILPTPDGPVLEAWLSGLAGTYLIGSRFGHARPVPTGLSLEVDGVGSMRLVRSTPAEPATTPEKLVGPAQRVVTRLRSAVPDPVAKALGRRGGRG